jgi:hypothetical protein
MPRLIRLTRFLRMTLSPAPYGQNGIRILAITLVDLEKGRIAVRHKSATVSMRFNIKVVAHRHPIFPRSVALQP